MSAVRAVRARETHAGPATEGLERFLAEIDERLTAGGARSAPQTMSDWHHHGDHTACVYVVKGQVRVEWGAGGGESVELSAGDFYVVPPNTVHREGNPGTSEDEYLGFWIGSGPIAVNVDGPE